MTADLRAKVTAGLPGIRQDLEDLVRIESVSADPERFDDPMWSLVARSQEIVVQHYSRVDEQMMWVTVAEGFPEIEDLVQGAREGAGGADAGVYADPGPLPLS